MYLASSFLYLTGYSKVLELLLLQIVINT